MLNLGNLAQDERDMLKIPLEQVVVGQHITLKDIRKIDKVCGLLEKSGDVNLEDADFAYLKEKFEAYPNWNPMQGVRQKIIGMSEKLAKTVSA